MTTLNYKTKVLNHKNPLKLEGLLYRSSKIVIYKFNNLLKLTYFIYYI